MADPYTQERKQVDPKLAEMVSYDENKLLRQMELVVQWPAVNSNLIHSCIEFLEQWTWASNGKAQLWVKDPVLKGKKYPGTFRKVRAFRDPRKGEGVFLMLRKGFAQAVAWDEAFIQEGDDLQEDERYLHVVFPNIDPKFADAIKESLSTHTTNGFTVDGKARTGTWEYVHRRQQTIDDGSMVLNVVAGQTRYTFFTYDSYGAPGQTKIWYLQNVPKRLQVSIEAGYRTAGDSGIANYSTQEGVVDMQFRVRDGSQVTIIDKKVTDGCQLEVYRSLYFDMTKTEADAFSLGDAPQGWFYRAPVIRPDGGGRWVVIVEKEKAIAVSKAAHTSEKSNSHSTTETVKKNQTSVESLGSATQGVVKFIRATLNKYCTWDTIKLLRTSTAWSITWSITTESGTTHTHIMKGNQRSISMPTLPANKEQRLVSFSRNIDGTYNWHVVQFPEDAWLGNGNQATYYKGYQQTRKTTDVDTDTIVWQERNVTIEITMKQFTTLAAAVAYSATGGWLSHTSPFMRISRTKWIGFKQNAFTGFWNDE